MEGQGRGARCELGCDKGKLFQGPLVQARQRDQGGCESRGTILLPDEESAMETREKCSLP